MPDSYPPFSWGPPPFEERDLDALLSGETADTPFALRQVADALAALRAAPAQAELTGEAIIMAEFSAVAEFRAQGLSEQAARAGGEAHTLELPATPAVSGSGTARRRGARHRGRRGARRPLSPRSLNGRPLSRRAGVVVAGAVAAVIVATAAVAANLHGPLHPQARPSAVSSSASQPGAQGGSQSVAAKSASTVPASHSPSSHDVGPAESHPRPDPQAKKLCETYFGYFKHPEPKSRWATDFALFDKLSKLAGGPFKVLPYCAPYIKDIFPHGPDIDGQQAQDSPGPPGQSGSKQDQGPPGQPLQKK
jgi:hypothetical protein